MESELLNAAKEGRVETLLKLLRQDEFILLNVVSECSQQTPLHIAVMYGHLEFTKAVLKSTPLMARELDSKRSTPLHLATAHGHILIVKELLLVNPDMCFAKDWEGKTPIHIAVIKGHTDILKELVRSRPQAAQALLGVSTIMHLCIKHYQKDALAYILQEVIPSDDEFVNSKDEEGYTILHLAVAEKQPEVVKFLLERCRVDVTAKNKYGLTAFDVSLAQGRKNIKDIEVAECFQQAGESGAGSRFRSKDIKSNDIVDSNCNIRGLFTKVKDSCCSMADETKSERKKRLEDSCNALMIIASLIATVTFQAVIQPPDKIEEKGYSTSSRSFLLFNTLSFSTAMFVILLLISGLPLRCRLCIWILRISMWIAVLSSALSYHFVMEILTQFVHYKTEEDRQSAQTYLSLVVGLLIIILTVGNAIRVLLKMVKCFWTFVKENRCRTNSNAQDHQCCV